MVARGEESDSGEARESGVSDAAQQPTAVSDASSSEAPVVGTSAFDAAVSGGSESDGASGPSTDEFPAIGGPPQSPPVQQPAVEPPIQQFPPQYSTEQYPRPQYSEPQHPNSQHPQPQYSTAQQPAFPPNAPPAPFPNATPGHGPHTAWDQPVVGSSHPSHAWPDPTATGAAEPGQSSRRTSSIGPWGWVLRCLGLFAVSLVSGLVWLAVGPGGSDDDEAAPPPSDSGPAYDFNMLQKEGWLPGCAQVSTDQIQEFFEDQECVHRTRALYTSTLDNGDRVVTSVVTVLMADEQQASELDALLTRDGTGNIDDLVDEDLAAPEDLPGLDDDAYGSDQQGELVVIGDSAYLDRDTPNKDPRLLDATREALKLGWPQDRDNQ